MRKLFFLVLAVTSSMSSSGQVLPDGIHSLGVLVQIPTTNGQSSFGTGTYITHSNHIYFATAAHVIFDFESTNKSALLGPFASLTSNEDETTNQYTFVIHLQALLDQNQLRRHPTHDVAVIQVASYTQVSNFFTIVYYQGVRALAPNGTHIAHKAFRVIDSDLCREYKDVRSGADSYILGHPVDLFNTNFFSEVDYFKPLVRRGIISQKNDRTKKYIIDTGVYGGNSGGPVLTVTHPSLGMKEFRLVGFVTQFVPVLTKLAPQIGITNTYLVNTGYGVVEPVDYALELIRGF